MRILFAVASPLAAELGASQVALNLSKALRAEGLDVVLWTPPPAPAGTPWWRHPSWMRSSIVRYVKEDGAFDLVDVPPLAVSMSLARLCPVIARSVQPDLAYLWTEIVHGGGVRSESAARRLAGALFSLYLAALVMAGWFWANRILCLGRAELASMRRWFPWWRSKLCLYVNALGEEERRALAEVRNNRRAAPGDGVRLLWVGRWTAHKGVDRLLTFAQRHLAGSPSDRITIAGCGSEAATRIPPSLLQDEKIRVVPSYSRSELPGLLASHDAGLFTSRAEGWGLTLQEMLESGMPVYATEAGCVADLAPFLGGQLRRFPPTPASLRAIDTAQADWRRSDETFRWRAIARRYAAIAFSQARVGG
jgi:glycosyltransferase involved in cell wall biosynthesis